VTFSRGFTKSILPWGAFLESKGRKNKRQEILRLTPAESRKSVYNTGLDDRRIDARVTGYNRAAIARLSVFAAVFCAPGVRCRRAHFMGGSPGTAKPTERRAVSGFFRCWWLPGVALYATTITTRAWGPAFAILSGVSLGPLVIWTLLRKKSETGGNAPI
jgi:hypothetical protein